MGARHSCFHIKHDNNYEPDQSNVYPKINKRAQYIANNIRDSCSGRRLCETSYVKERQ